MYANIGALQATVASLKTLPNVVALTETWLKSYDKYHLDGYQPIRVRKRKYKKGGGVACFIRNDPVIIDEFPDESLEMLTLKIQIGEDKFVVSVVYKLRSLSKNDFLKSLEIELNKIHHGQYKRVICGDFNKNLQKQTPHTKTYIELLMMNGLYLQNDKSYPTRKTSTGQSCIDHIAASFKLNCIVLLTIKTNHYPILASLGRDREVKDTQILRSNLKLLEKPAN